MKKVLVIIVTYNGMKWLGRCLSSVRESSLKADIFVVDNGSTDGSVEYIRSNFPEARLQVAERNLGFGAANNMGLRYAIDKGYEFVYLLNQDAWLEDETLRLLVDASESNPDYGILSPLQVNGTSSALDTNFSRFYPESLPQFPSVVPMPEGVCEVRFAMAAHWLMTRRCLLTVGLFSPTFFHYGEDSNYVDRLHYHRLKIGIVPRAIAIHDREFRQHTIATRQREFGSYGLIYLSNPNSRLRYPRWLYHIAQTLLRSPQAISLTTILDTVKSLGDISRNRRESKNMGAFIKTRVL